jgi:hypothetical protein
LINLSHGRSGVVENGLRQDRLGRGDVGLCVNEEQKESNNRLIQVDNNILNDEEFEPMSAQNEPQRQYDSTLINEVREVRVP